MKQTNWKKLILCILFVEALGFLSSLLAGDIRGTYQNLINQAKPYQAPLAPPPWLFAVVWPVLYLMLGIALYLILQSRSINGNSALRWFCIQLILNLLWPLVFFRFHQYMAAAILIIILDIAVAYTIYLLFNDENIAGCIMVPYFLWLLFATYLNIGFALL